MTLENRAGQSAPGEPGRFPGDAEVQSITDAAAAHSVDMHKRMVKYALAMGIRMVCLILIFVVDGWFKLIPVAGAVFLPWIAVIIANGSDLAEGHSDLLLDSAPLAELEAPAMPEANSEPGSTLLQGELVDETDLRGQTDNPNPGTDNPNPGEERRAS